MVTPIGALWSDCYMVLCILIVIIGEEIKLSDVIRLSIAFNVYLTFRKHPLPRWFVCYFGSQSRSFAEVASELIINILYLHGGDSFDRIRCNPEFSLFFRHVAAFQKKHQSLGYKISSTKESKDLSGITQRSDFRKAILLWYEGIDEFEAENYKGAAEAFEKCIKKSPACVGAYYSLYYCFNMANDKRTALLYLAELETVSIDV